jgi:hypothetical protein
VRNCPVKGIRVKDDKAQVISERRVVCGVCVFLYVQRAARYHNDTGLVKSFLKSEQPVVAILLSMFPAAFKDVHLYQIPSIYDPLGKVVFIGP